MIPRIWADESRKTVVCIDRYQDGVPQGRICNTNLETESFSCLTQLLIKMEAMLDELQAPQAYTQIRTFSETPVSLLNCRPPAEHRTGRMATFEVQVIFRQHTSWQGVITWLEERKEHSFRSVLELVMLMDSALREQKGEMSA